MSGDFFSGLNVPPAAGRLINSDDDRTGAPPVVVVSYAFSQRRFGGASNAAGQPVLIDNLPFTVVGVTPPEFFGVDPATAPDVYFPLHANELLGARHQFGFRSDAYLAENYYWIHVLGRLRPGVSIAQAQATLAPAFQQWVAKAASNDRQSESSGPGSQSWRGWAGQLAPPLFAAASCIDDDGGVDPCPRLCECARSAAARRMRCGAKWRSG